MTTEEEIAEYAKKIKRSKARDYYKKRKPEHLAKMAEYQKTHPEVYKKAMRKWRDKNRDWIRYYNRCRMRGDKPMSKAEWEQRRKEAES